MHYKMNYAVYETRIPALHPIHPSVLKSTASDYRLSKPKGSSSRPKPFDPDDLTRRLYVVLAERKAHAETKRHARAAVEAEAEARRAACAKSHRRHTIPPTSTARERRAVELRNFEEETCRQRQSEGQSESPAPSPPAAAVDDTQPDAPPTSYRHVPRVAASQFARTTTVETLSEKTLIHKLSRQALRSNHPDSSQTTSPTITPVQPFMALGRSSSLGKKRYDINPFRHAYSLAPTVEAAEEETWPSRCMQQGDRIQRRRSTGDVLNSIVASLEPSPDTLCYSPTDTQPSLKHCQVVLVVDPEEHRVDWTQSDEIINQPSKPPVAQQLLRKAESRWALKAKLGNLSKYKAGKRLLSSNEDREKPFPARLGFFARFKR